MQSVRVRATFKPAR